MTLDVVSNVASGLLLSQNKQIFKYYVELVRFREAADARTMLKCINPKHNIATLYPCIHPSLPTGVAGFVRRGEPLPVSKQCYGPKEAGLIDSASGIHVRCADNRMRMASTHFQ
jgi:hypothetical protein